MSRKLPICVGKCFIVNLLRKGQVAKFGRFEIPGQLALNLSSRNLPPTLSLISRILSRICMQLPLDYQVTVMS